MDMFATAANATVATGPQKLERTVQHADFEAMYRREYSQLVRVAYALCGRIDIAEEIVQDAMTKTYTRWSTVKEYERPGAFVRKVVVNDATSALRRKRAEVRALVRFRGSSGADTMVDPEVDEFWRLVRTLPARQAQVVALFYADDHTTAEIANVLDIAEGTVRATLTQARATLRATLEEDK